MVFVFFSVCMMLRLPADSTFKVAAESVSDYISYLIKIII